MKQKDLLFLLISATFLAVVWIIFTILHNSLTSTISQGVVQQIQPISNTFDNQTLQALQKRQQISPVSNFNGTDSFTPTPTPTLIPVATVAPTGLNITPTIIETSPTVVETSPTIIVNITP